MYLSVSLFVCMCVHIVLFLNACYVLLHVLISNIYYLLIAKEFVFVFLYTMYVFLYFFVVSVCVYVCTRVSGYEMHVFLVCVHVCACVSMHLSAGMMYVCMNAQSAWIAIVYVCSELRVFVCACCVCMHGVS